MKIGLYFGSFNPIHIGHLIIANHFQNFTDLDQVWFVISPQNPFKKKSSLANEFDRLDLVEVAIKEYPNLRTSDIEFRLPKPSYTIDTLIHLEEKYPNNQFCLIMGSDNFEGISLIHNICHKKGCKKNESNLFSRCKRLRKKRRDQKCFRRLCKKYAYSKGSCC